MQAGSISRMERLNLFFDNKKWIYWLQHKELRQQLPWIYRLFAEYYVLQDKLLGGRRMRKGPQAYSFVNKATQWLKLPDIARFSIKNFTVFLNLSDPRFFRVVAELLDDSHEVAVLKHYLKQGDTFIDVGANYGSFSIFAAHLLNGSGYILSVEPQPRLANLVRQSLSANPHVPFEVSEIACANHYGTSSFYIPDVWSGQASFFKDFSGLQDLTEIVVNVRRFDETYDWKNYPGNVFLKLDIEGGEYAFLQGAQEMLRTRKPKILIEINPASLQAADTDWHSLLGLLDGMGYHHYFELSDLEMPLPIEKLEPSHNRNVLLSTSAK